MSSQSRTPSRHERERGMALAITLFGLALLSLVLAASLLVGSSDARATRSYRRTTQIHFVAESGILHAVQIANRSAGIGVENFQNDVVNNWGTIWSPSTQTFSPLAGFTYSVVALPNPLDPGGSGWFRATASGPEGATNTVVASVSRSIIPSTAPGALHLADPNNTNCTFNGTSFQISGNDLNYTGGNGPGSAVPGISTLNDTNTQEAITSLSKNQDAEVTGLGYSANPLIPSVKTSPGAPSPLQIDAMIAYLLQGTDGNGAGVVTMAGGTYNNSTAISGWQCRNNDPGAIPEVTHFTGDVDIKGNGNISGEGILIVDGNLSLKGNLDFKGLIIVRGTTQIGATNVSGSVDIWGSLWTTDINMVVGGNSFIQYSTQALTLANQVNNGRALPSKLVVNSLVDCAAVPPGTNNC